MNILDGDFSVIIDDTCAVMTSDVFLSSSKNKEMLIAIFTKHLKTETTIFLQTQTDADTVIVSTVESNGVQSAFSFTGMTTKNRT